VSSNHSFLILCSLQIFILFTIKLLANQKWKLGKNSKILFVFIVKKIILEQVAIMQFYPKLKNIKYLLKDKNNFCT